MDNSSDAASNAAASMLGVGAFVAIVVYFIILLGMIALFIWIFWKIFTKAGFNGALAFLNLVPGVGNLICILILAFSAWPVENELAIYRSGGTPPPPVVPPSVIPPAGNPPLTT